MLVGSDDPVSESYAVVGWDPIGRINFTIAVLLGGDLETPE